MKEDFCCVIDAREKSSRIEHAMKFFNEQNITTKKKVIPVGDYIFNQRVVFEWKTPSDFVGSVMNRRIFKQAQRMRQYPYSYIIIVGNVFDWLKEQYYIRNKDTLKEFTVENTLGALATLHEHDKVIMVENEHQAFTIMSFLAKNILTRDKSKPIEKPVCKMSDSVGTFLCCIDQVSTKKAILIREHLKLNNLRDLLEVTKEDLLGIRGIGASTADKIMGEIG